MAIPVVILVGGLLATGQEAKASSGSSLCKDDNTKPCLSYEVTSTSLTVTLTRNGYTGNWSYSMGGDLAVSCTGITGDSVTVQNLLPSKSYSFAAHATCSGPLRRGRSQIWEEMVRLT